jgi:hypothetical protein
MNFASTTKFLICCDTGNLYFGKLMKPTQGPYKIIDVHQLPINCTICMQWSPTSVEHVNVHWLLPFFEHYKLRMQMFYLSHYDIMTHSHFDTWHHNKISKACRASKTFNLQPFFTNASHSHDNLRRVFKSPLLHPFTCRRSGTLDWHVMRATSADSSRLIHSILAHSSTTLLFNLLSP